MGPTSSSQSYSVNLKCRTGAKSVGSGYGQKGMKVVDFTATTLDCKSYTLNKVISGHPALLTFFASWCQDCKNDARATAALYSKYHGNGFQVVGIDTKDEPGDPTPFYTQYGYNFPSVWDDGEKISSQYFASSQLPVNVWVKCDGTINSWTVGATDSGKMETEYQGIKC
jgi:peroxiredoxin